MTKNITTIHNEVGSDRSIIGYDRHVTIIETALREQFGIDDSSYLAKAVAANIWSKVAGKIIKVWGTEEIHEALAEIKGRIKRIEIHLDLANIREATQEGR